MVIYLYFVYLEIVKRIMHICEGEIKNHCNKQIKEFQDVHFTKKLDKDLNLNKLGKDRDHIPAVLLSKRKYAIAIDKKFRYALLNFPRFKATVVSRPEDLNYEK